MLNLRRSPGFRDSESPERQSSDSNLRKSISKRHHPKLLKGKDNFRSVCLSNIPIKISDSRLEEHVSKEFKKFGVYNLSITMFGGERVAYVNFRKPENAIDALNNLKSFEIDAKPVSMKPIFHNPMSMRQYSQSYRSRSPARNKQMSKTRGLSVNDSDSEISDMKSKSGSPRPQIKDRNNEMYPSRTIFVGNLSLDVTEDDLFNRFSQYGEVLDIDRKTNQSRNGVFAFIRFPNSGVAESVKSKLDGKLIRNNSNNPMKVGCAKSNPTHIVFVGGLGAWLEFDELERQVFRALNTTPENAGPNSGVKRINWPRNQHFAFIIGDGISEAQRIVEGMRKSSPNLLIGYSDVNCYRRDWERSTIDNEDILNKRGSLTPPLAHPSSSTSSSHRHSYRYQPTIGVSSRNSSRRSRSRVRSPQMTTSQSSSLPQQSSTQTPIQITESIRPVWTGKFCLKKFQFGVKLHRIRGNESLASRYLFAPVSSAFQSRQSLTLNIRHKISMTSSNSRSSYCQIFRDIRHKLDKLHGRGYCLFLVTPCTLNTTLLDDALRTQKSFGELVGYLQKNNCAGVIIVDHDNENQKYSYGSVIMELFAPSEFVFDMLRTKFPRVSDKFHNEEFMLALLMEDVII